MYSSKKKKTPQTINTMNYMYSGRGMEKRKRLTYSTVPERLTILDNIPNLDGKLLLL
jgi:hypothetical protein